MAMRAGKTRRGFTLIELMVVIGLILLLLALAVPAFSFISGSRSVDAASNLVSAMLARARSEAVSRQGYVGVMFYRDPASDRSAMALVTGGGPSETAGDYYNGWASGLDINGAQIHYRLGEVVVHLDAAADANEQKRVVRFFVCTAEHDAMAPPGNSHEPGTSNGSGYWNAIPPSAIQLVPDTDVELLPTGIGAQVVNDQQGFALTMAGGNNDQDAYLRTDVVLFSPNGQLTETDWSIPTGSPILSLLDPTGNGLALPQLLPAGPPQQRLLTGVGVALYDLPTFRAQGFATGEQNNGDNDYLFQVSTNNTQPSAANEANEETWLNSNATLLTINRYTGTVGRTQ